MQSFPSPPPSPANLLQQAEVLKQHLDKFPQRDGRSVGQQQQQQQKKHSANNCRANDVVAKATATTTEPTIATATATTMQCAHCNCKMGLYCIQLAAKIE